jgi:NitT/TauT family transport system permease protein
MDERVATTADKADTQGAGSTVVRRVMAGTPPRAEGSRGGGSGSRPNGRAKASRISLRRGAISVVLGFALWELAIRVFKPSPVIVVGPSEVARAFWQDITTGKLWNDFSVSMGQFVLGYLVAVLLAVPLGLWLGASKRAHDYGDPWLTALYATPSVALAPMFIVALGFGLRSHVAVIAIVVFFPVIINTIDGVHAIERDLREVGIAYRARRREAFLRVDLPGALPYIFTGLRLGLARGLVGIVVADLFGATAGLGYLILNSAQLFQTAQVFVGVFVLAALGVFFTVGLRVLQRRLTPWQTEVGSE